MKEYFPALTRSKLFSGIAEEEMESLIDCLEARCAHFHKGGMIVWKGGEVRDVGVVVSGRARSIRDDASGKTTLVTLLEPGDFIGLLLAASRSRKSPVSVQAIEQTTVLFFPEKKLVSRCVRACPRHDVLLMNLLDGLAEKALALHMHNACLTRPTVREKVLAYLSGVAAEKGVNIFTVPMDRGSMAEYLNVERSALSRELSRMKRDGLIDFYKSDFKIMRAPGCDGA